MQLQICGNRTGRTSADIMTKRPDERKWFTMKALVVSNRCSVIPEQIARAVAAGLAESIEVQLAEMSQHQLSRIRRWPWSWLEGPPMRSP